MQGALREPAQVNLEQDSQRHSNQLCPLDRQQVPVTVPRTPAPCAI